MDTPERQQGAVDRRHLTLAEDTREDLIRGTLASLPRVMAIEVPTGHVAVTRAAVVAAGLDPLAIARWLQPRGGFGNVAYLRTASHRVASARPALQPVPYFAIPLAALSEPDAQSVPEDEQRDSAVA
jgi:hypothetical protein